MGSPPVPSSPPSSPSDETAELKLALESERRLIGTRDVTFRTRDVPPPSMLYISADDDLYINVSNVQAGQSLTFAAQTLLPDGRLQPNVWTVNPPSTGAQTAYLFPLPEGYLFNLTATPSPSTRRGTTWIYAAIRRGSLQAGVNLQTLLQNYVDSFSGPTWPGGQVAGSTDGFGLLQSATPANPAPGANFGYTFPNYVQVQVKSVFVNLFCSAQVANRSLQLLFYDASNNLLFSDVCEPAFAANANVYIMWSLMLGYSQSTLTASNLTRSLPSVRLPPSGRVVLNVVNIQTSDQLAGPVLSWEQWFSL